MKTHGLNANILSGLLFSFFLLFILCAATNSFAAVAGCDGTGNCYIYAAASGSGNGSSWTNAYTGFGTGAGKVDPASMTRGATYWIATGSYGAQNFSSPNSGSTVITLEGATTTSHGPASDWNDSFAGQATFIGNSFVSTDYWTFDGQAVPGCSYPEGSGDSGDHCYTIHFWNKANSSGSAITAANSVSLIYVELEGTGQGFPNNTSTSDKCNTNNCGAWADNAIAGSPNNLYVGYSYVHHTGNTQFQMNNTPAPTGHTYEYNWISYNHTGQNGQHDEAYSLYASNVVIRYNVFQDISGSGIITTAGANTPALSNWAVYGNLFFWDATYAAFDQYGLATCDNAILDFLGESMSGHIYFYNNTIAGMYSSVANQAGSAFSTMPISGLSGYSTGNPTVIIENNLWYGSAYVYGDYSSYCSVVGGATCTQDYNASYQGGIPSGDNWQTNSPAGAHDYNVSGSGSPFLNFAAFTIAGLQLVTPDPFASHAGTALGSPYNVDMFGVTRGANGTWDLGALQLSGGSGTAPAPPTNLQVNVN